VSWVKKIGGTLLSFNFWTDAANYRQTVANFGQLGSSKFQFFPKFGFNPKFRILDEYFSPAKNSGEGAVTMPTERV